MASDLWREAPVLLYRLRAHTAVGHRRYVLHPAWAYRVSARRRRVDWLNPLQRATLGLCGAGLRRPDVIGARLGIHTQLVGYIVLQLDDRGLLDRGTLEPTAEGKALLAGAEATSEEMLVAHVFQDPWTGDVLGAGDSFPVCRVGANRFPIVELKLGTRGSPDIQSSLAILPGDVPCCTPPVSAVWRALREGMSLSGHAGTIVGERDLASGGGAPRRADLEQIFFVGEPRRVFLVTYAYVPRTADGSLGWFVCHPLGPGADARLRRVLQQRLNEEAALERWLQPVLAAAAEHEAAHGSGVLDALAATVRRRLEAELGAAACQPAPLCDALVEWELAYERECRPEAENFAEGLTSLCLGAAHVLAALLRTLTETWSTEGLAATLPARDREHRERLIEQAAVSLGAAGAVPLPLQRVSREALEHACEELEGDLPSLLLAAVLAGERTPGHPLRRALQIMPQLLHTFLSLAEPAKARRPRAGRPEEHLRELARIRSELHRIVTLCVGTAAQPDTLHP